MAMSDSHYYGRGHPSGYSSVYRRPTQSFTPVAHPLAYSPYSRHYNYQRFPRPGSSYHARGPYTFRFLPQSARTPANFQPTNIPANQPKAPAKLILPSRNSATPSVATGSSANELESDSEKGFKLLDDLVETISQAASTSTDSDIAEVNAIKSIFADVIDEIIRQVEIKFKENDLDTNISNVFLRRSETTKKAISDASSQSIIAAILIPYINELKSFTSRGFQITA